MCWFRWIELSRSLTSEPYETLWNPGDLNIGKLVNIRFRLPSHAAFEMNTRLQNQLTSTWQASCSLPLADINLYFTIHRVWCLSPKNDRSRDPCGVDFRFISGRHWWPKKRPSSDQAWLGMAGKIHHWDPLSSNGKSRWLHMAGPLPDHRWLSSPGRVRASWRNFSVNFQVGWEFGGVRDNNSALAHTKKKQQAKTGRHAPERFKHWHLASKRAVNRCWSTTLSLG